MTSTRARVVPWHAVVQYHREVAHRARRAFFALPVSASALQRWSPLDGFEPAQLAGPWEVDREALASDDLKGRISTGIGETFIGGPCWYRLKSSGEGHRHLDWIPLIYREVKVEERDGQFGVVPAQDGWHVCPLVTQLLKQRNVQTVAPLDEMLPDLLSSATSTAANDGSGLTAALVEAFRAAAPDLGQLLDQARDKLPVDDLDFVPSPWVLFAASAEAPLVSEHICRDYDRLNHHLASAEHDVGGIRLLEDASGDVMQAAPEIIPVVPLEDKQQFAVEAALSKLPVTIVSGPPGCGKSQVVVSILLNAWAASTSVLYASNDRQTVDSVCKRLKTFDDNLEIVAGARGQHFDGVGKALARTHDVIAARQGESYYGGSPAAQKRNQLVKKKQILRELLDGHMPQRVAEAIQSALKSYAAYRKARSALESRRKELASELRALGVGDEPDSFEDRVLEPLRKWRSGAETTRRLIEEDAQRIEALKMDLATARADRDSALSSCQIEIAADEEPSWLLIEPGFKAFEQAMNALSEKLRDPIEEDLTDASWDSAYDVWSSSAEAAEWERKARETASLLRPASISLKEKTEELNAAQKALDATHRDLQTATKASNFDARREDLDEWATRYAELCALPRSKFSFLHRSKDSELVQQLENVESRFRSTFPSHLWSSIGKLDETGRGRLSEVVERGRDWFKAQEDWDRLSVVREEIEAETDALRQRLVALDMRALSKEVTPTACAAIASKLNDRASLAAAAAQAWRKREDRERLPGELIELTAQIRAAGSGTPVKERWMTGPGAALMASLDAVKIDSEMKTIMAVRKELLESAQVEPLLQSWRRAYEAEQQRSGVAEELERIPPRAARLAHWKSRRPTALPAELEVEDAFDGDESHPVWALLVSCEQWSRMWAAFRTDELPGLERAIDSQGAAATRHIAEAAQALPPGKDRAWLESLASGPIESTPWPVEKITEKVAIWRPKRLQAEIEKIDAQLERITFETVKDRWFERVARDAEGLRALDALREHYEHNDQRVEEDGYALFERSLKLQPVWVTTPMSAQPIPMTPELFDLLVIDDARKCSLTNLIPLIFRAKCLVVVGDPDQAPSADSLGIEAERTLAGRFGIESWAGLFGHVGNDAYKSAVGDLPGRKVSVISLVEGE